jgi:hypothetical protein
LTAYRLRHCARSINGPDGLAEQNSLAALLVAKRTPHFVMN